MARSFDVPDGEATVSLARSIAHPIFRQNANVLPIRTCGIMIFMAHRNAVWAREFNAPTTSDDAEVEKNKENSECANKCA
jgi:hypothetical protein